MEIKLFPIVGSFAENKDLASEIRLNTIIPLLKRKKKVILNFVRVDSTTQSFVHALISDIIRKFGVGILDMIFFKNCNETIKKIINIVVDYMQESIQS
ncbi:MAG: STAS-like domain-containing protein [Candidatus Woesearchaeota archaeon]